ncbi:putative quinol monooxygenase [Corallococcus llansteffanensis]|uniref:Antibiotic biosynthesis monooxygenase n=1 Tax=Corallococcus llansteffanensis TaxID=2316731 RepID=A0A3A8QJ22_9BACT|nr:putative quinol monooxygenase [Corallococcus llansteffanensis]RKH67888.1 antibiotic biosynthesis monooxygenase [Corallococcus llansteffanensis]
MSDERVEMTAFITAKPGKEVEIKAALNKLVTETVKEPGCVLFRILEDLENPGRFVLWEIFQNRDALRVHMELEHTRNYFSLGLTAGTQVMKLKTV